MCARTLVQTVNVRCVRIEPLSMSAGDANTCHVDNINTGLMPVQIVLTTHKVSRVYALRVHQCRSHCSTHLT